MPQKFSPRKLPPVKHPPPPPPPQQNHTNERKNKIKRFFCLEESCAIQHPYQNHQGPL